MIDAVLQTTVLNSTGAGRTDSVKEDKENPFQDILEKETGKTDKKESETGDEAGKKSGMARQDIPANIVWQPVPENVQPKVQEVMPEPNLVKSEAAVAQTNGLTTESAVLTEGTRMLETPGTVLKKPKETGEMTIPKLSEQNGIQKNITTETAGLAEQTADIRESKVQSLGMPVGKEMKDDQVTKSSAVSLNPSEQKQEFTNQTPSGPAVFENAPKHQMSGAGHMETMASAHLTESGNSTQDMEKISEAFVKNISQGRREFEIQLLPKNLGKLLIKVSYEAGKTAVSILCTDTKTMQAISQNARELGNIMETHLGTQTQVVVDKNASDYLEQHQSDGGQAQDQREDRQPGRRQRESRENGNIDFLQQLRLGLA